MRALERHSSSHRYIEDVLDQDLARASLSPVDRALCQELCYGTVRWQATLDWLIERKTGGRRQPAALKILLRLGLYQLFWLTRIPDHAAVHETVQLAKELGFGTQSGFVNALLRGYTREKDATRLALDALKKDAPHLGYSHPEWLIERWEQRWSESDTDLLLDWNNTPPPIFARLNSLKTDADKLLELWRSEKVESESGDWDWIPGQSLFQLKSHPPLVSLGSFRDGCFYLQDPSTLLAVNTLDPQPGESVLDLCAAPGGKTTLIAARMKNEGRLVAADASMPRLRLIHENCARLGVTCAKTVVASKLDPRADCFDRILVDAPCSNSGVMRRRVDLRWRIEPEEINQLAVKQLLLLNQAAAHLKPGGTLVYSTCSLEPEENSDVVKKFLAAQPSFKLETERELLPFKDAVDGAYVARLCRS